MLLFNYSIKLVRTEEVKPSDDVITQICVSLTRSLSTEQFSFQPRSQGPLSEDPGNEVVFIRVSKSNWLCIDYWPNQK